MIYRCRKTKPRNFVDIPTYTTEKNNTTHDDYDHVVFTWNSSNNNSLERSKIRKSASEIETGEAGMSDENNEAGVYNTLNLRVFDYEEPIKHQPLKRSKSENSSFYVKCSIPLEPSAFDSERVLNCNRVSSLRLTTSTDRNNFVKDGKGITKSHENDEPFLDFNVHDLATLPGKSNASQRQLFLNELSSQLLNLKKN